MQLSIHQQAHIIYLEKRSRNLIKLIVRLHQFRHEMVQQYEAHDVQQAHDRVFEQGRSVPEQRFPPGMGENQFSDVIQNLNAIVGDDHVHTGESLLHFSDPFSPHTENFPSAAVW